MWSSLGHRVLGRVVAEDVLTSAGEDVLIPRGTFIDEKLADVSRTPVSMK